MNTAQVEAMERGQRVSNAQAVAYLSRLKTDPTFFLEECWRELGHTAYAPLSFVEIDMFTWLNSGPALLGLLAGRGVGKTTISNIDDMYWLNRDPNHQILICSKSADFAKATIYQARQIIDEVWFLRHLAPGRGQRDTAIYFDVGGSKPGRRQPSYKALGVDGQLEGNRAHLIKADDVETDLNTKTIDARVDLHERVKEFDAIIYPNVGRVRYIGTYHHEESLYVKLPEEGYDFRSYPTEYPAWDEDVLNLAPCLQERLRSGQAEHSSEERISPVFPDRFGEEECAAKRAKGPRYYGMQFKLLTNIRTKFQYPLAMRDVIVFESMRHDTAPVTINWGRVRAGNVSTRIDDPELPCMGFRDDALYAPIMFDGGQWAPYGRKLMWIDPAGTGEDETAYAVVAAMMGMFYVIDVGGFGRNGDSGFLPTVQGHLADIARKWGVREILYEDNMLGRTFGQLMEPTLRKRFLEPGQDDRYPHGWTARLEERHLDSRRGCKEERIADVLEGPFHGHRVVMHPRCIAPTPGGSYEYELQHQITRLIRMPKALVHDDRLDAVAGAVHELSGELVQDSEVKAERYRFEEEDARVAREMEKQTGYRPSPSIIAFPGGPDQPDPTPDWLS